MTSYKIIATLECMIWVLTKRQVVYRIHKLRWKRTGFWADNLDRHTRGMAENHFKSHIFATEFAGNRITLLLKEIHKRLRPSYLPTFNPKLDDAIERCIEEKYIERRKNSGSNHLVVLSKGRDFISLLYFPKQFFGNAWVKAIGFAIITALVTFYVKTMVDDSVKSFVIELRNVPQTIYQLPK